MFDDFYILILAIRQLPSVAVTDTPMPIATADADSEEDEMEKRLQALRS